MPLPEANAFTGNGNTSGTGSGNGQDDSQMTSLAVVDPHGQMVAPETRSVPAPKQSTSQSSNDGNVQAQASSSTNNNYNAFNTLQTNVESAFHPTLYNAFASGSYQKPAPPTSLDSVDLTASGCVSMADLMRAANQSGGDPMDQSLLTSGQEIGTNTDANTNTNINNNNINDMTNPTVTTSFTMLAQAPEFTSFGGDNGYQFGGVSAIDWSSAFSPSQTTKPVPDQSFAAVDDAAMDEFLKSLTGGDDVQAMGEEELGMEQESNDPFSSGILSDLRYGGFNQAFSDPGPSNTSNHLGYSPSNYLVTSPEAGLGSPSFTDLSPQVYSSTSGTSTSSASSLPLSTFGASSGAEPACATVLSEDGTIMSAASIVEKVTRALSVSIMSLNELGWRRIPTETRNFHFLCRQKPDSMWMTCVKPLNSVSSVP